MKKKTLLCIGLASALTVGAALTAIADSTEFYGRRHNDNICTSTMTSHREKGHTAIVNILKDKFGVTAEDIQACYDDGKSLGDLATEKNIDLEEFKTEFTAYRDGEVDEALEAGDITAEDAASIKESFQSHMEDFDFSTHFNRKGRGHNSNKGNGSKRGNGRGHNNSRGCN